MSSPGRAGGVRHQPRRPEASAMPMAGRRSASGLLLARRLVEAGVPFVTFNDGGWDDHSSSSTRCPEASAVRSISAVAALIKDLDQRGLLDTTLVIGRWANSAARPRSMTEGGRDHWSNAMSVLFAGGGTPGGQVVGGDRRARLHGGGADPRRRRISRRRSTPSSASIPAKILYTPQGRPTHLVSDPTPIRELMG